MNPDKRYQGVLESSTPELLLRARCSDTQSVSDISTKRYNGQAAQDYFVRKVLKDKRNGTFLEIGSRDPIDINNTYPLEKELGWRGFMVEYDTSFEPLYREHRPNSIHLMRDATTINYKEEFEKHNFPKDIDYLQIDLEVSNGSTLLTLLRLEEQVFKTHRFAVVTFEHDIYGVQFATEQGKELHRKTREISRKVFLKHGYIPVFLDVQNIDPLNVDCPFHFPFEDWWVHPELVDMKYIEKITTTGTIKFTDIVNILDSM